MPPSSMPPSPSMGPKSQTLGLLIALAILSAVSFPVLYFKSDLASKQIENLQLNLSQQVSKMEDMSIRLATLDKKLVGTDAGMEKKEPTSELMIPAMEEARVKAQEIDGQGNPTFTLKQGEAAKITFTNSGGEVFVRLTLASLNSKGAILGLQGGTWPIKVLQITPDTKTFTYSAYTFTILGMTSDSLTLKPDFSQN